MQEIYVYGPNEENNDYSTMGLVGALVPTECRFKEVGNGDSFVTLKHPLDDFGRYSALEEGNIISVPVPVRLTPEIQNGSCVTTVWTYKVKPHSQLTSKYQRTLFKKKAGSSRIQILKAGETVTVVLKPENDDTTRWKAKSEYGTGWINPDGFELVTTHVIPDNSEAIQTVQSPWTVTRQLYRIQKPKKTMTGIELEAKHISYDLLYNMTRYSSEGSVTLQTAIDGILNDCYSSHDFVGYTNVANEQAGLMYKRKNPVDAFLNPEEGICKKFNVGLVRDNYSLYFLHDPGMNRGVRIEYAKNMTGISFQSSDDEVVTRIVPVGETKDGEDLLLSDVKEEQYIDSPNIGKFPIVHIYELKCENCKVGETDDNAGPVTKEIARARMRAQAEKMFENKCDQPKIEMHVEFVNLGDTYEYQQYKDLENCFLYDYVIVQHPKLGIDVTAQILEIEWDVLLKRMISVTIGSVGRTLANAGITTWQIPTGFSGTKIADSTIPGMALQNNIVSTRHIQSESVNTGALQAKSVTAEKIDAEEVFANKGVFDILYAKVGEFIKIAAGEIEADKIITDELAANIIEAIKITAGTAEFDKATIQHLVANSMNLTYGVGEEVFIDNLAVRYAQMIGATIGSLCIKSSNGKYYYLDVDENGNVTATDVSVEIGDSGVNGALTPDGKHVIVETSMTVDDLNTTTLKGVYALINRIEAASIDTDELFARKAFIDALTTSKIFASGDSLEIVVSNSIAKVDVEYYLSSSKTELIDGVWSTIAPVWTEGKYMWQRTKTTRKNNAYFYSDATCIAGAKGADGVPGSPGANGIGIAEVYEQYYLSTSSSEQIGGQWLNNPPEWTMGTYLWIRSVIVYTDESVEYTTPYTDTTWELAEEASKLAGEAQNKADAALNSYKDAVTRPEFERIVRIDNNGLHVGDNLTNSEMLIDSGSINAVINGVSYSSFGANYLQLGDDMQMRRPSVGGVIFSPIVR